MEKVIEGVAKDIETIARLRPWMEQEARDKYGVTGKTKLITDYDQNKNLFKFKIIFADEPQKSN